MDFLDKWIRIKLGQDLKNPSYIGGHVGRQTKIITNENYNLLKKEDKGWFGIYHKRICFDAQEDIENNKNICDLFKDDLNGNRLVIHSRKGSVWGYIISNEHYTKYDYWNENWEAGCCGELTLPYIYIKDNCGGGTINIFKDLIINHLNLCPNNE